MAVALYLRVSTEEQRERQSIATQNDFASRYCAMHQNYANDGVSGTVPVELRPAGSRVLLEAKLKRFDQVLIYKLDRIGRHSRLILNIVAELEKQGIRGRSMTEAFKTHRSGQHCAGGWERGAQTPKGESAVRVLRFPPPCNPLE